MFLKESGLVAANCGTIIRIIHPDLNFILQEIVSCLSEKQDTYMKKAILSMTLLFIANALWAQSSIQKFEQLMSALNTGKSVKAVIY